MLNWTCQPPGITDSHFFFFKEKTSRGWETILLIYNNSIQVWWRRQHFQLWGCQKYTKKHPRFAFCCHLTPSTYAMWQNLPLLARSNLSAFTADSWDHENKMKWSLKSWMYSNEKTSLVLVFRKTVDVPTQLVWSFRQILCWLLAGYFGYAYVLGCCLPKIQPQGETCKNTSLKK